MRLYDPAREAELVTAEAASLAAIDEMRQRLTGMNESDEAWDEPRFGEYQRLQMAEAAEDRQLGRIRAELDRIRLAAPRTNPENEVPMIERFLRRGMNGLTAEEQTAQTEAVQEAGSWNGLAELGGSAIMIGNGPNREERRRMAALERRGLLVGPQMAVASDAASGENLIDTLTQPRLVEGLSAFGGARRTSQIIRTARGNPMRIPRVDASGQEGELIGDQGDATAAEDTPNIGFSTLGAHTYSSKRMVLTVEMIQDAEFDIQSWTERQAIRRLGRITNKHFTNSVVNGPTGFVPKALTTTTAAAAAAFTWEEVLQLQYDVDEAYLVGGENTMGGSRAERGSGMIGYTFGRPVEGYLRKLKDGDGRPLWQPDLVGGGPGMLLGYPYELNFSMDAIATGKKPIVFGNFEYHVIRESASVMVYSFFDSRTAERYGVEIIGFCRDDSNIIGVENGGETPAFAALTMA